jgi:hypothetical protein
MTKEQLQAVRAMLSLETDGDGWFAAPADRFLTLTFARDGAAVTVAKVEALRADSDLVQARTHKGETFVAALSDVVVVALDAPSAAGRKAGFGA